ncbi:MAG: hypothetical protein A2017_02330 [Lentisphaerae bacterium GWF2_44_16]|nr:MAG: hypothetical protein A2017_02330 [Lentisphaerae bacterium GWF2_44_16]
MFFRYWQGIRCADNIIARKFPSLIVLSGILCGILPGIIFPDMPVFWRAVCVFAVIVLSFIFISSPRYILVLSLFSVTALIIADINSGISADNYSNYLSRPNCGAIIKGVLKDSSIVSRNLSWLPKPSFVKLEISGIKYGENEDWKKVTGKLYVKLPEASSNPGYDNEIILKGEFMEIDKPPFKGAFDFGKYLELRKIYRIFYASECEVLKAPRTLESSIMNVRDFALVKVTDGIKSPENKRLLTTMFFGCRQGLDWKDRQTFIMSGTIHIFSVSGLHVGILALILFWAFRFLPFRARYLLVPFLILIYTVTTGMQPPAVRALLMISLWSFSRAFLHYTSPLNVVFASASLLLLWNPFYIMDIGFQYSFVTVAFLILSYNHVREWTACISERLKWTPSLYVSRGDYTVSRLGKYVFLSVFSCLIAWLASTGISASYQGLYVPFAVPANILISPLIPLVFIVAMLKLLLIPFGIFADFAGSLIDYLFYLIDGICRVCAYLGTDCHIVRPPLFSVLIFYSALLVFVVSKRKLFFIASLALISFVIIFWHLREDFASPEIFLFHGGRSQELSVLICDPASDKAFLVNAPSSETCRNIANLLSLKGIDRIDTLIFCGAKKDFCAGAKYLMSCSGVNRIIVPGNFSRSPYARDMVDDAYSSGILLEYAKETGKEEKGWSYSSYKLKALSKNGEFSIEYNDFNLNISLIITDGGNGMRRVKITVPGTEPKTVEFENRNNIIMKSFCVNEKKT